ncbi:hypothetical protein D3C74_216660 [compost metagenome]
MSPNKSINFIDEIIGNNDSYSWKEVNCFFKPMAILCNSFNKNFFDIFLFYTSFFNSYQIDGWFSTNWLTESIVNKQNQKKDFSGFFDNVLEDRLGLSLKRVYFSTEEEMHSKIISEVDKRNRILVPGDLFAIYYDDCYKTKSHGHFFIIKGYDLKKKIYYILDTIHLDNGSNAIYKEFIIDFTMLSEACKYFFIDFHSYQKGRYFWLITQNDNKNYFNYVRSLLDYRELLENENPDTTSKKYIEEEFIKIFQNNNKSVEVEQEICVKDMFVRSNFRKVHYDILFKMLREVTSDSPLSFQLHEEKLAILKSWKIVRNKIAVMITKKQNNYDILITQINEILENESNFKNSLIHFIDTSDLKKKLLENMNQKSSQFIVKNRNEADVIFENDRIIVTHSILKSYNTWVTQDYGVELLVNQEYINNFSIETEIQIKNNDFRGCYRCGIIIRFEDGNKFLFGIDIEDTITVHCPEYGETSLLHKESFYSNSVNLKVTNNSNYYMFYVKTSLDNEWNCVHKCLLSSKTMSFGLLSATWETIDHEVTFINPKLLCNNEIVKCYV